MVHKQGHISSFWKEAEGRPFFKEAFSRMRSFTVLPSAAESVPSHLGFSFSSGSTLTIAQCSRSRYFFATLSTSSAVTSRIFLVYSES